MSTSGERLSAQDLLAPMRGTEPRRESGKIDILSHPLRSCLMAVLLGACYQDFRDPVTSDMAAHLRRSGSAGLSSAMLTAMVLGTTGAGSDMDPLDLGPAHLALPATAAVAGIEVSSACSPDPVAAVNFGCTVGARLRSVAKSAKPGVGLHSVSSFGIVAAAAAAGRSFGLDDEQLVLALCIALDRAAGFAVNNNSTDVGITHFGWAAAHGIESAWLAREGVAASTDLVAALEMVFPGQLSADSGSLADVDFLDRTIFKSYPVNIYLNCLYDFLSARRLEPASRVEVSIPDIPRLAIERPRSYRELRNTVRGVAALALTNERSYRSFTAEQIAQNRSRIDECIARIDVVLDARRPTSLESATLGVWYHDASGEQSAELEVSSPGAWDWEAIEALLSTEVSTLDERLLRAVLHGPLDDAIRGVAALVVHGESETRRWEL